MVELKSPLGAAVAAAMDLHIHRMNEQMGVTKVCDGVFFVTKKEIYIDYVNSVIKPAINLLDGKYKELAWRKCNYAAANPNIMQLTGLPCYTFHTFILERMMAQYCRTKELKIINLFN